MLEGKFESAFYLLKNEFNRSLDPKQQEYLKWASQLANNRLVASNKPLKSDTDVMFVVYYREMQRILTLSAIMKSKQNLGDVLQQ